MVRWTYKFRSGQQHNTTQYNVDGGGGDGSAAVVDVLYNSLLRYNVYSI